MICISMYYVSISFVAPSQHMFRFLCNLLLLLLLLSIVQSKINNDNTINSTEEEEEEEEEDHMHTNH